MEYTVHELKKRLRKNRVQITICLLLLAFVGVIIAISYPSRKIDSITNPVKPSNPETPKHGTEIITDFTIISTYQRQGGPYFT